MSFDSIYEDRFHRTFDELLEIIREQDMEIEVNNAAYRELFEKHEYALDEIDSLRQRIAELEANQQLNNI